MHRVILPLVFDAGLSPGESSDGNRLMVARDGNGQLVLRGSSLAGALRQAWRERCGQSRGIEEAVFGAASGAPEALLAPSRLEVADCVITLPKGTDFEIRTHNQINRHTGVAMGGALYSVEALPPGCTATIVLWLRADVASDAAGAWIADIVPLLEDGLLVGGRVARGLGLARLGGAATRRTYNLAELSDHAAYLDDHWSWRRGLISAMSSGQELAGGGDGSSTAALTVDFTLYVPRGQDFVIGSGGGGESNLEPQTATGADGKTYWRVPGSTLRGLFRGWVSRLAVREGRPVAFSRERRLSEGDGDCTGEEIGWCFIDARKRKLDGGAHTNCPVAALFGWLGARGRVHISDALVEVQSGLQQRRAHVAVDNVTGGAVEGMFFQNDVVVGDPASPIKFAFRMRVENPQLCEARWLESCLRAMDRGLIRVGSSKAAGRLALAGRPAARGRHSQMFAEIIPSTVKG